MSESYKHHKHAIVCMYFVNYEPWLICLLNNKIPSCNMRFWINSTGLSSAPTHSQPITSRGHIASPNNVELHTVLYYSVENCPNNAVDLLGEGLVSEGDAHVGYIGTRDVISCHALLRIGRSQPMRLDLVTEIYSA